MKKIIVIEPSSLLRLGIVQLLSDMAPDITLEGYGHIPAPASGEQAPPCDLVLLAVSDPSKIDDIIARAEHALPASHMVLMLEDEAMSSFEQPASATVAGCISKNSAPEVIRESVRLVLAGGKCFPLQFRLNGLAMPRQVNRSGTPPAHTSSPIFAESKMLGITQRQYEVLVLLARGYPMKTVGHHMKISVATAKAHTKILYERLDVHSRNAAVYAAVSRGATLGWVPLDGVRHVRVDPAIHARDSIRQRRDYDHS